MSEIAGAASPLAVIASGTEHPDGDEPPSPGPHLTSIRHPAWTDVPEHQWLDWRWQAQNAVRHAGNWRSC